MGSTMPETTAPDTGDRQAAGTRLVFIDSLRGAAAIYVLMFHLLFASDLLLQVPSAALAFLMHGNSGVTLFFIVSAFSLCHAHQHGFTAPGSLTDFFIRRAARVLPLFYFVLAYTLLHNASLHMFAHSAGQVLRAILLVFNLVPGEEDGIVPAAWSIGVEVLFYACFPWLFPRLQSLSRVAVAVILSLSAAGLFHAVVGLLPYTPAARSSYFTDSFARGMPIFLLGIGAWIVFRRHVDGLHLPLARAATLIAASALLYAAYINGALSFAWPEPYYAEAVVYALLLIGLAIWPAWPLVSRATSFCGRISYSIYLLHVPAMAALAPAYDVIKQWPLPGGARFTLCLLVTLACLLPVATLSYLVVEKPGMEAGKMLLRRLR